MAKTATVVRKTRGPTHARVTRDGSATAYAVKKAIWSHRGVMKTDGSVRGLEAGEIKKSAALAILERKAPEAKAPFVAKSLRGALVLTAA